MENISNRLSKADAIAINISTVTTLCKATMGNSRPYTFVCGAEFNLLKQGDAVAVRLSDGTLRVAEVTESPLPDRVTERDFWPGIVVANLSEQEAESDKTIKFLKELSGKIDRQLAETEREHISKLLGVDVRQLSVDTAKDVLK